MSQHEDAIPPDAPLNDPVLGTEGAFGELSDLARG
jgi:hypothetical protein